MNQLIDTRYLKYLKHFLILLSVFAVGGFMSGCGPEPPPEIIGPGSKADTALVERTDLPPLRIPADNPLTLAGVDLGRHLFYDPMLSGDGTQACGTCHNQKFAFTDNGNPVSQGIRGSFGKRNAMTIFNLMWVDSFFWDSRAKTLRQLATMPIENPIEMDARIPDVLVKLNNSAMYRQKFKDAFNTDTILKEHLEKALEQFLLSITSDNSKFDRSNRGEVELTSAELKGFNALKIKGCFNCHSTSLLIDNKSHNTALDPYPKDSGKMGFTKLTKDKFSFKTPSLRNIMVTAPYMHDGRFMTIDEVIRFYEEVGNNLNTSNNSNAPRDLMTIAPRNRITEEEMADIKAFLNTLTDEKFLNNPKYSDPF
ncbi:MAG: c-type cytochrome [Flavobacteriales bacterium]|nr:c-type cytochrome [Flavobacteriales bacterium]